MELRIPRTLSSSSLAAVSSFIEPDVRGSTSFVTQQFIVSAFCPKISVLSSHRANALVRNYSDQINSVQEFLGCFEEEIANVLTERKLRKGSMGGDGVREGGKGVGKVRFVGNVFENYISGNKADISKIDINNKSNTAGSFNLWDITRLHDDSSRYLDVVLNKIKGAASGMDKNNVILENSIYLNFLKDVIATEELSPYDTFNNPIVQLIVITADDDTPTDFLNLWKEADIPKWFDLDSVQKTVLILVEDNDEEGFQKALHTQENLKLKYGTHSSVMPINTKQNSTDVNLMTSLFQNNKANFNFGLSQQSFNTWLSQLIEIVTKELVPFMDKLMNQWNDETVAPKKSLTSRLFNSKKWGSSNKSSFFSFGRGEEPEKSELQYNPTDGYYNGKSPEMIIRRLADWYFMMGDYKNSYNLYDLIKKDMTNDKAYIHSSSLQEFIVASLLLGASNRVNPFNVMSDEKSIQSITSKMIADIITPALDSTFYSYLSRFNMKSHSIRLTIIMAELYLLLGQSMAYTQAQSPTSVVSGQSPGMYYSEAIKLFKKIIDSNLLSNLINSFLIQRVAYIYYTFDKPVVIQTLDQSVDSYYEEPNLNKILIKSSNSFQMSRKSVLWMLLAANQLDTNIHSYQVKILIDQIESDLGFNREWLEREDSLLAKLKLKLKSN